MSKMSFLFWLEKDSRHKYHVTVETDKCLRPGAYCSDFFQEIISDDRSLVLLSDYKNGSKQDLAAVVAPTLPHDRWSVVSSTALR